MFKMRILICVIALLLCSICDVKYKAIDIRIVFTSAAVIAMLGGTINAYSLLPGLLMLVISFLFPRHMGMGDGAVFLFIGMSYGFFECVEMLLLSFLIMNFYALIISGILYCKSKIEMKWFEFLRTEKIFQEVPFIPFVFISFGLFNILSYAKII